MAIPSESQPGTRLGRSGLAQTGFQLGQQIKADEDRERARYEKAFETVGGQYFDERDIAIQRLGSMYLDMATDPKYFNAKVGSPEHQRFLRFGNQYKQILQSSADNNKLFRQYEQQLGKDPSYKGKEELVEWFNMGNDVGDLEIDEYGNALRNGQPLISSDYMSAPPMVRKERAAYTDKDFLNSISVGSTTDVVDGVVVTQPKDVEFQTLGGYRMLEPWQQQDLLESYIRGKYNNPNLTTESIARLGKEELNMHEQGLKDYLVKAKRIQLNESKKPRSKGGDFEIGGVNTKNIRFVPIGFKKKVNRTPLPLASPDLKAETELDLAEVSIPTLRFNSTDPENRDYVYFINRFAIDQDGNAYVTGKKVNKNKYDKLVNLKGQSIDLEDLGATGESIEDEPITDNTDLLAQIKGKHSGIGAGGLTSWNDFQNWIRNEYVPSVDKGRQPQAEQEVKMIENPTEEQYNALPKGAKYIYEGVEYIKE